MDTLDSIRQEMRQDMQEIKDATRAPPPIHQQHVHTTFNAGGIGIAVGIALGIGGLAFGYGVYVRSEAREAIAAAERRADMAQIQALQSQVRDHTDDLKGIRAWLKINGETLAKLEAQNAN